MNYTAVIFHEIAGERAEILMALLSAKGFESFEEKETSLVAFITSDHFNIDTIKPISEEMGLSFSVESVPEQNWNKLWESNFEPVSVGNFVLVRADFHEAKGGYEHEIVINPKMSFGTGHHATTSLMMAEMSQVDFKDKNVFDFGTGTGILAILAAKLNAGKVIAIDNDEWSITNAKENAARNQCNRIEIHLNDHIPDGINADIILANINRNVLLQHATQIFKASNKPGVVLISGIMTEDEGDIKNAFAKEGFSYVSTNASKGWLCMKFTTLKGY